MASKYDGLARIIIQNVGGKQNINSIRSEERRVGKECAA